MGREADERTSIRLRAGHVDEERLGFLDRGALDRPSAISAITVIVSAIRGVPWQGRTATIAHHVKAETPATFSEASSNGSGPADERHTKRNVLFDATEKFGVHSSQP